MHFSPTAPIVSVLMATHDDEKTVRRAADSLTGQGLGNFELVVADRNSADSTPRILDTMAERDLRVVRLNVGACSRGEALDAALERARGQYVMVMDPDGWLAPNALDSLVDAAERSSLELVVGGLSAEIGLGGKPRGMACAAPGMTFGTQHDFRAAAWHLFDTGQMLPACGKLFLRSHAESSGARFAVDGPSLEDHAFVAAFLRDVERVGTVPGAAYHVRRMAPAGTGPSESYDRLVAEHEQVLALYRHWGLDGDTASVDMLLRRYLQELLAVVERICSPASDVAPRDRTALVARMIGTERAKMAAGASRPHGVVANALLVPIRSGNAGMACAQASLLSRVPHESPALLPDFFL